jgi:hypothetical protein
VRKKVADQLDWGFNKEARKLRRPRNNALATWPSYLLPSLHFAERQFDDSIEQNKTEAQPEAAGPPTMIVSGAMSRS